LSDAARAALGRRAAFARVLTGGDDYEVLFAAQPGDALRLRAAAKRAGVRISRIGRALEGRAGHVSVQGMPGLGARAGFTHF
jgi:thiamine-monophosphate kinase